MKLVINRSWMISLACAAILILANTAGASDGVIEINQACATTAGCVANDSAGFPVFIGGSGAPRSYILTSDLVPTNDGSVLFIDGDDVSLDMNGFSILCGPLSTYGIRYDSARKNLHVWNGTIVGCQKRGIGGIGGIFGGGHGAHIDRITVNSSPGGGISVGDNSLVENSSVTESGTNFQGIDEAGIRFGHYCIARNNIVSGAKFGIQGASSCVFKENVVRDCGVGLKAGISTFSNNTATNNGTGIFAYDGSNVIGNTLRGNTTGLNMSTDTTYRGNAVTESTSIAIQGGIGQNRGGNTCLGAGAPNPLCP